MHCDKQTSQFCNIYYKHNVLPNCKSQLQSSIGNCVTNATFPYFVEFLLRTSICNLLQMQHVHTLFNSNYKVQFVSFTTNPKFPYAPLKLSVQIFPLVKNHREVWMDFSSQVVSRAKLTKQRFKRVQWFLSVMVANCNHQQTTHF